MLWVVVVVVTYRRSGKTLQAGEATVTLLSPLAGLTRLTLVSAGSQGSLEDIFVVVEGHSLLRISEFLELSFGRSLIFFITGAIFLMCDL